MIILIKYYFLINFSPELLCQVRVLTYIVPAMLASVALNIPKFFEARLDTMEVKIV